MVVMSSNDIMDVRKGELTKRYKLVEPLWKSVGFLKKKKKIKNRTTTGPNCIVGLYTKNTCVNVTLVTIIRKRNYQHVQNCRSYTGKNFI